MKSPYSHIVGGTGRPCADLRVLVAVMALHAGLIGLALHAARAGEGPRETVLSVQLLNPMAPARDQPRPVPPKPQPPRQKAPEPVVARVKTSAPVVAEAAKPPPKPVEPPAPVTPPAPPAPVAPEPVLQPPRFDADYLSNPSPSYPVLSRRLGESGKVLLRVQVGVDGLARQVLVQQSSGFDRLDDAAREAVAKWRFVPARRGTDVLTEWVIVPVVFNLTR